jgi:hypothetical protein
MSGPDFLGRSSLFLLLLRTHPLFILGEHLTIFSIPTGSVRKFDPALLQHVRLAEGYPTGPMSRTLNARPLTEQKRSRTYRFGSEGSDGFSLQDNHGLHQKQRETWIKTLSEFLEAGSSDNGEGATKVGISPVKEAVEKQ